MKGYILIVTIYKYLGTSEGFSLRPQWSVVPGPTRCLEGHLEPSAYRGALRVTATPSATFTPSFSCIALEERLAPSAPHFKKSVHATAPDLRLPSSGEMILDPYSLLYLGRGSLKRELGFRTFCVYA